MLSLKNDGEDELVQIVLDTASIECYNESVQKENQMVTLTKQQLMTKAQAIYEGIAPDVDGWDLGDAASMVADRMYDEFGPIEGGYYSIAKEALRYYF